MDKHAVSMQALQALADLFDEVDECDNRTQLATLNATRWYAEHHLQLVLDKAKVVKPDRVFFRTNGTHAASAVCEWWPSDPVKALTIKALTLEYKISLRPTAYTAFEVAQVMRLTNTTVRLMKMDLDEVTARKLRDQLGECKDPAQRETQIAQRLAAAHAEKTDKIKECIAQQQAMRARRRPNLEAMGKK
jgi:hypothetical protein